MRTLWAHKALNGVTHKNVCVYINIYISIRIRKHGEKFVLREKIRNFFFFIIFPETEGPEAR